MDRGRMWERRGGYERVEVRRGEVRKQTDVPLQCSTITDVSLPQYMHQETESGWMEATSPPTDHRLSCHTDA
jgi:hypothetical protein